MRFLMFLSVAFWLAACVSAPSSQPKCSEIIPNEKAVGERFDLKQAQIAMTLSALSYVDDTPILHFDLRRQLKNELEKKHYAMAGKEKLVWGPVIYLQTYNLAYVTRNAKTGAYTIVLRGTSPRLRSWWEDVALKVDPLPGSCRSQDLLVSRKFGLALAGMLRSVDAPTGMTLTGFLKSEAQAGTDMTIYVTGHSQGGGLTPMMLAFLSDQSRSWNIAGKLSLTGYAFAPPTSGNAKFADFVSQNLVSYQISNPLDVVPFGYASMNDVITQKVPEAIPDTRRGRSLKRAIRRAAKIALRVTDWKQPDQQMQLRRIQLPPSLRYLEQVKIQHIQSAYLYLLGAPPVDFVKPTRLKDYDTNPGAAPFPANP